MLCILACNWENDLTAYWINKNETTVKCCYTFCHTEEKRENLPGLGMRKRRAVHRWVLHRLHTARDFSLFCGVLSVTEDTYIIFISNGFEYFVYVFSSEGNSIIFLIHICEIGLLKFTCVFLLRRLSFFFIYIIICEVCLFVRIYVYLFCIPIK